MLAEVRHRDDVDLGLVHEGGGACGGQGRRMDGVVEGLQHRVRPRRRRGPGVEQRVAEEAHHARGVERQRRATGAGELVEGRLAAPGTQRVTGQTRRPELPARHDMQELEPAAREPRVERSRHGVGFWLARANYDGVTPSGDSRLFSLSLLE